MHIAWGHTEEARTAFGRALEGFRKLDAQADVRVVAGLLQDLDAV